jgi:hypothetical protein
MHRNGVPLLVGPLRCRCSIVLSFLCHRMHTENGIETRPRTQGFGSERKSQCNEGNCKGQFEELHMCQDSLAAHAQFRLPHQVCKKLVVHQLVGGQPPQTHSLMLAVPQTGVFDFCWRASGTVPETERHTWFFTEPLQGGPSLMQVGSQKCIDKYQISLRAGPGTRTRAKMVEVVPPVEDAPPVEDVPPVEDAPPVEDGAAV